MEHEPDLLRVISRAVCDARAAGLDYGGETSWAMTAVEMVRPGIGQEQARSVVKQIREHALM